MQGSQQSPSYPKVSIITTCYNYGKYIEKNILSVKEQDYANIEHVIVDGASTDSTLDILKKYNESIMWISEPDEGEVYAENKGLKMATADIVGFLNADDYYDPGAISYVVEFFDNHPHVKVLVGAYDVVTEDGRITKRQPPGPFESEMLINAGYCMSQPSTFFRKEVFEEVGIFDTTYKYAMDLDLFIRIALRYNNNQLACVPVKFTNFLRHAAQKSGELASWRSYLIGEREALRISRKYGGSVFNRRHRRFLTYPIKRLLIYGKHKYIDKL